MTPIQSERLDARLYNWALFQVAGERGASITAAYGLTASGGRRSTDIVPTIVGEAMDTERLVRALHPAYLIEAVIAWYVWTGTIAERCSALKIHRQMNVISAIY